MISLSELILQIEHYSLPEKLDLYKRLSSYGFGDESKELKEIINNIELEYARKRKEVLSTDDPQTQIKLLKLSEINFDLQRLAFKNAGYSENVAFILSHLYNSISADKIDIEIRELMGKVKEKNLKSNVEIVAPPSTVNNKRGPFVIMASFTDKVFTIFGFLMALSLVVSLIGGIIQLLKQFSK